MNACRKNRQAIVGLVTHSLDASQSAELVKHLQQCETCRQYHEEMLSVAQTLERVRPLVEPAAGEPAMVRSVAAESIDAPLPSSAPSQLGCPTSVRHAFRSDPAFIHLLLSWRVALPAFCALVLAIVMFAVLRPRPEPPALPVASTRPAQATDPALELAPTLGAYRAIANQSLDDLDLVLTAQASHIPRPPPLFTATTLALARLGD